jgi:hypothetical protein
MSFVLTYTRRVKSTLHLPRMDVYLGSHSHLKAGGIRSQQGSLHRRPHLGSLLRDSSGLRLPPNLHWGIYLLLLLVLVVARSEGV